MITGAELVGANAATGTLRSLYDFIRQVRNSNDPAKLRDAIDVAFERLLTAREQVAALQDERAAALDQINALQKQLDARIDFEKHEGNYELRRFHPGTFTYLQKGLSDGDQNAPRYCQPCFVDKKLSMLQPTGPQKGSNALYFCPKCKTQFVFGDADRMPVFA
jgi:hypothetical protein